MIDTDDIPDRGVCEIAERAAAVGVHLTNQEAKIIEILDARQALVSRRAITNHLYAHDPDGGPLDASNNLAVVIHRLRKKGFTIKLHHGLGYALTAWPEGKV